MNKRIKKKKLKYTIDNIQKVNLKEGEFLVFKYDINKFKPEQIHRFAEYIKNYISEKVFFVPKEFEMIKMTEIE